MTQPHMGRPRPRELLRTTNRRSRGISGFAKVDTGAAGGPGHGGTPWPRPPRPARDAPEQRGGQAAGAGVPAPRPLPPPLPRGASGGRPHGGTRAPASLGAAPRGGFTRPAAPTCPLPGPAAPTSSWAPATAASALPGPRGPGGTCAPQIRIRERRPWLWVLGEGAHVLELEALVFPTRSKHFLHIKNHVPSCCLDLAGLFAKPSLGGARASGRRAEAGAGGRVGVLGSGSWARAVPPRASRFEPGHPPGEQAEGRPHLDWIPCLRLRKGGCGVGGLFCVRPEPPNSSHLPEVGHASSMRPCLG